ncbi:MAG: Rrf2 family transcriptional regulator [Spirochaetia bacterium]|nr:Rrf2 family transcriptional regulator [Spirochaetia bacterium]
MKMSTRSRYGLRFMFELALHYKEGPVLLRDIAERHNISEKYLSKLVIPLKGIGLINTYRGAHGGYSLAIEPEKITVKQIVDVLEGDTSSVECIQDPLDPTWEVWSGLDKTISDYLESINLETVVQNNRNRQFTYVI